ncbi:hypothetical protein ABXT08_20745 [Chryseobacterium sp. NRRL B-14859]|uniref:hypothetical protein n=1 Tax=Chryseobacterium sp. NRRL B-14859 TaxID=1562763 RepID=UPI003398E7D9
MKKLLTFLSFLLITGFHAQNLKAFSIPEGYKKIAEAKGDLDKDGQDEIVWAFDTDIIASEIQHSSGKKDYQRVFYILKNTDNGLKIWKENSTLLFSSETGFYPEDNILELGIKNNSLNVRQQFFTNSRHTQSYKHTFRFQNGDFYLIGSQDTFDDTCDFSFTDAINFSTGKVVIDKEYSSCDEETKVPKNFHKEFTYKLQPLIKMNHFKIGEHKIKIPGSKEYFIF